MPYITRENREHLDGALDALGDSVETEGDLAYAITRLCLKWLHGAAYPGRPHEPRFADHNAVMGVLSCVAHEFYRSHTAPYEIRALILNGDVRA